TSFGSGSDIGLMNNLYNLENGLSTRSWAKEKAASLGENGDAFYEGIGYNYTYGDVMSLATIERLKAGYDKLKIGEVSDPENEARASTKANKEGQRTITLESLSNGAEFATDLAHESRRDGSESEDQELETAESVISHTKMAQALMDELGVEVFSERSDLLLETDIQRTYGEGALAAYAAKAYDSSADYWKLTAEGKIEWDGEKDLRNEAGEIIRVDKTGSYSQSLLNWFGKENAIELLQERGINTEGMDKTEIAAQLMNSSGVKWDKNAINSATGKIGSYVPIIQDYQIGSSLIGMHDLLSFQLSEDEAFHLGKISQESPDIAYWVDGPTGSVNVMASTSCFFMSTLGGVQTQAGEHFSSAQINSIRESALARDLLSIMYDEEGVPSIYTMGKDARRSISQLAFAELGQFGYLKFNNKSTGFDDGSLMVGNTVNGNNHAREGNGIMQEIYDPYEGINYISGGYLDSTKSQYYNHVDYQEYYWDMYGAYCR
ncbi:MAG: hypothetical protein PQJ46_00690, partial [Spirochaetales bacterium]|nr:hypothetical protein [Spirochaetales bacterium]